MSGTEQVPTAGGPGRTPAERPEDVLALERELERIVTAAQAELDQVRREIAEHRRQDAQHAEIDRLEEHLANATVRWSEVRAFFEDALVQLRDGARQPAE